MEMVGLRGCRIFQKRHLGHFLLRRLCLRLRSFPWLAVKRGPKTYLIKEKFHRRTALRCHLYRMTPLRPWGGHRFLPLSLVGAGAKDNRCGRLLCRLSLRVGPWGCQAGKGHPLCPLLPLVHRPLVCRHCRGMAGL